MTQKAKEKAEKLVVKFSAVGLQQRNDGIKCALIAIDVIIKETMLHDLTPFQHGRTGFWLEVKQELEKL